MRFKFPAFVLSCVLAITCLPLSAHTQDRDEATSQQAYLTARQCFTGAIEAFRDNRWSNVDTATRTWTMAAEAWHVAYGWRMHGMGGDCLAYYQPSHGLHEFEEWTLIAYAPVEDVRIAYARDTNLAVNLAFLTRWLSSDTFPEDMLRPAMELARPQVAMISNDVNAPLTREQNLAALVLMQLSARGRGEATYWLALKSYSGFTLQQASAQGHYPATAELQRRSSPINGYPTIPNTSGGTGSLGDVLNSYNRLAAQCSRDPSAPQCRAECRRDYSRPGCQDTSTFNPRMWNDRY